MGNSERIAAKYRAGDVIAERYHVEALLGQGGAGAVYRVREERHARKIALKQLQASDAEQHKLLTSQFAREYHTLSQLAHPHVIEVYDYGVDAAGAPFYTMELLDGEDLHERGKLPFQTACVLLRDVASSLAVLHARGLIHRDVSARNVRCARDGSAKLLDFGAMAQMGMSQRAVGTPPFVPPEVLQLQALDARADLYGLGALAYWTLTGRHAYPARTFTQLREAWRRTPRKPVDYAADIPQALSELVLSLLRLDREERPRTAAEVMERLSGIARLTLEEVPEVGRAYFVTPKLVGRDEPLQRARAALSRALQTGHGDALLIEGGRGMGRSRFLDACVLEAKLMGATVLRGSPADAEAGEYGVAKALLKQLFEAHPELCEQTAEPRAALLVSLLPELAPRMLKSSARVERRHLHAALRDFFLSMARGKHLALAVDDFGAIDEPSAALLVALSHGAIRRKLTLFMTAESGSTGPSALLVVRELSQRVQLQALDEHQTQALYGSLFGDHPRAALLAQRIYPVCEGSPQQLMAMAEHLVSRGVVRYEAGGWALPLELRDEDLPQSDAELNAQRVAALSPDALELAQVISLTELAALSLPQFAELCEHRNAPRSFAALDELVRAGLLRVQGNRYCLAAPDALAPLAHNLAPAKQLELHGRLSQVVSPDAAGTLRIRHMLLGGREREAIDELLSGEPVQFARGRLEALVSASEAAERLQLATQLKLALHERVSRIAAIMGRVDLFERYGSPLIARLRRDSGLADYLELDPGLDPRQRLAGSFARAQERYAAAQRDARGFEPRDSVARLIGLHAACMTLAAVSRDLNLAERLDSLEPWFGLSWQVRHAQKRFDAQRATLMGHHLEAAKLFQELLHELDDDAASELETRKAMRTGFMNILGITMAASANPGYESAVAALDRQVGHRGNAWRIRMVYRFARGEFEAAQDCAARADLLELQDSGGVPFPGNTVRVEFTLCALGDYLPGVKRAMVEVAKLASSFAGWRPMQAIADAELRRLQGDEAGALQALRPALELTAPARHPDWSLARSVEVKLLTALGRAQEAVSLALRHLEEAAQHSITVEGIHDAAAEALLTTGRLDEALRLSEAQLAQREPAAMSGILLGRAHETRARVAIAMHDAAAFEHHAERCATAYLKGRSSGLRARYERLLRAAAEAGFAVAGADTTRAPKEPEELGTDDARTVYSRMLTCVSPVERAERALQLLLEATGARTGYFFGLRASKLELLFNPEPGEVPPALTRMLEECLRRELDDGLGGIARDEHGAPRIGAIAPPIGRFIDELGREFEPLVLTGMHEGEALIVGVAALHYPEDDRSEPRRAMLDAVIEALLREDVVDPITCMT